MGKQTTQSENIRNPGGKCSSFIRFSSATIEIALASEHSTGRKHGRTKALLLGDCLLKLLGKVQPACLVATSEGGQCERCRQT